MGLLDPPAISQTTADTRYISANAGTTDGTLGYSSLWKHARVSPAPNDRIPVIAPTLTSEGVFTQEPQVWVYGALIHMIYTGGGPAALHYASCPVAADPLVSSNWTKAGAVLGQGAGGAAGLAQHAGVYVEGSTLYLYYGDASNNLSLATASLDTPTTFTLLGTIFTPPAGTSTPIANPHIVKRGPGDYLFYFEANTTTPLWQVGVALGTAPTGPFTSPQIPLPGLSTNPGFATSSNPFVVAEDGGYTMWFHSAWGRFQRGSGSPTVGYMATSTDGITWTLPGNGHPTVRLSHPLEVTQVADFTLVDIGAEKYAFWSANSTNNNETNTGQIVGTRVRKGLATNVGGAKRRIGGSESPTGPVAPWPWLSSSKLAADFTTTSVSTDVRLAGLSNTNVVLPDTVRAHADAVLSVKSSADGQITVKFDVTGSTSSNTQVVLEGQQSVSVTLDVLANKVYAVHLKDVFTMQANKAFTINWRITNNAAAATTTVLAGSSTSVDTRKVP